MNNEKIVALSLIETHSKLKKILGVLVRHVREGALTFVAAFDIYIAIAREFMVEPTVIELKEAAEELEGAEQTFRLKT